MTVAEKSLLLKQDFDDVKQAGKLNPIISSEYLNGNVSGTVVTVNDVIDMSHDVGVQLSSKNLCSDIYTDYADTTYNSLYIADESLRMSLTDKDTSVDVSGCYIGFAVNPNNINNGYRWIVLNGAVQLTTHNGSTKDGTLCPYVIFYPRTEETFNKLMQRFYIQVELGTTATEYTPYIEDFTKVNLSKNLFDGKINQKLALSGSGNNRTITEATIYNSAIIEVKPNTTYCISGDFDSTSSRPTQDKSVRVATFTNYPQVGEVSNQFSYGSSMFSIKTSETSNYMLLWFMMPPADYQVGEFQVEEGNAATKYIPYQTLAPVEIGRYGKNLFNKDKASIFSNWINNVGGYWLFKVLVGKGSTVTVSYKQDLVINMDCPYVSIVFDIANKSEGIFIYHKTSSSAIRKTLTSTATEDYIYVRATVSTTSLLTNFMQYIGNDLQIEINSTNTAYEPYVEPTIYQPASDGTVKGITSIAPNMTLLSDNNGVVINAHYYKDPDIVMSNLQQSVALSGGE